MTERAPLLLVGLDAAELCLVEELCAAGQLPALQSLRQRGCFGSLESSAMLFAGGVWPTFSTGKEVPWHGLYHNRQWRADMMRCEMPRPEQFLERPFWERLDPRRYRVAVLDVPATLGTPAPLNGIHLAGWGAHDLGVRGSWPSDLWRTLLREFGPPRMPPERYGPQSAASLARLRSELLAASRQMGALSAALLEREAWDLFLAVLGPPHRAGHYLWDLSQVELSSLSADSRRQLEHALADVYRACDDVLAGLLERAPRDATILVFALHGMGRNPGWSDHFSDILARILAGDGGTISKSTFVRGVDRVLPRGLIRPITNRLPESLQNALVTRWYGSMVDPRTTRCFPLLLDQAGGLRVNLRGRESQGIVEPGREYEELCRALTGAFLRLRDIRTGTRIVERVHHVDELAPRDAPYRDALPDLVIAWSEISAIDSPGVHSADVGELRWHPAGRLPSGRAGNHSARGWFVAVGDGIGPGTRVDGHRLVDLAPTVLHWLGAEQPRDFQGAPIPALCGRLPSA